MAPVVVPSTRRGLTVHRLGRQGAGPQGLHSTFFYNTRGYGEPRLENLGGIRLLEDTHSVRIPMDAISTQITTTPFKVRSTKENPSTSDQEIAERAENWLRYGANRNGDTWIDIGTMWVNDLLSIDAGILELVPYDDASGELAEIYPRDGSLFTKVWDRHGRFPNPGSDEPAYWQFSYNRVQHGFHRNDALFELLSENPFLETSYAWSAPIGFARDQIVWLEQFRRSRSPYGIGRVQKIRRLVEILLNQDVTNLNHFRIGEIPEGLINIIEASQPEVTRTREWWQDDIQGREHKVAIFGGKELKWIPFRPRLDDLQFLESQEWYNKLCWYVMGVPPSEVGLVEDVNRANGENQGVVYWQKTLKPILDRLKDKVNQNILPFLPEYREANGELEFVFEPDNEVLQAHERAKQLTDLGAGLTIPNEIRKARGLDELPWGDMPQALMQSLVRSNPRWALQAWLGLDEDELPPESTFGFGDSFLSAAPGTRKEALRDEDSSAFPAVVGRIRSLKGGIAKVFDEIHEDLEQQLAGMFPDDETLLCATPDEAKGIAFDIARLIASVQISDRLIRIVQEAALEALKEGAKYHGKKAEDQINATLDPGEPEISLEFDVEDTFAARRLAVEAAKHMRTVEDTVRLSIRDTLVEVMEANGNVSAAKTALRERFAELSSWHAENVARTEILSASRHGSQALAESTDVIGGKQWFATGGKNGDGRTRSWHAAMHGKVVPKDASFEVPKVNDKKQPRDYPRTAFVVGDDQPFSCRCDQRPVLRRDMPTDTKSLLKLRGVVRKERPAAEPGLSTRQVEVLDVHGEPGESFTEMLRRLDAEMSRKKLAPHLGVSSRTLYAWLDALPTR